MNNDVNVLNNTIEDISVNDTQKKLDELKRSITSLSDSEKLEKKSEIESTISKIKLELVELKKDSSIDTSQIQNIEQQLSIIETDYNTFLNNIQNELSTLEQNIQDNEEEKDSSRWERNKKNVLIGGGVLGAGLLIRRWWKKRKERKSGGSNSSNNTERKPWYKRRWGIGLIGVGGIAVRKNRDKIKDKFNDLLNWITGNKKETEPGEEAMKGSFDKLSAAEKKKYFDFSTNVESCGDSYPGYFDVNLSDDSEKDEYLKARAIHTLDKEIGDLSKFGDNNMFDFMVKQSTDDFIDKITNWSKAKIHNFVGPYLQSIESFQPFGVKFMSKPAEAIRERLEGGVDREEKLQNFLKYNLNIFHYVSEKRILLKEKIAKEQVMGNGRLNDEPNKDEEKEIDKLLSDKDREKTIFLSKLANYNLANFSVLLDEYNIEVSDVSEETIKIHESFNEDRKEAFSIDEEGETSISRAKTEFLDGNLSEETKEELIHLCEWLLEDISGNGNNGSKNFFQAYTHLITDLFGGDEKYAEQFAGIIQSPELQKEIEIKLEATISKLKNNSFTQSDLEDLEVQANTYMEAKESLELSSRYIDEYLSSGFNFDRKKLLLLPFNAIKSIGKAFDSENSWWSRVGYGLGGLYVSGQSLYIYSKFPLPGAKLARIGGKAAIKVGQLPIEISKGIAKKTFRLTTGRRFIFGRSRSQYINNPALSFAEKERMFRYAYFRGEISDKRALRIAESIGSKTINSVDDLLKSFGITDPKHIELYKTYGGDKNMKDLLFNTDRAKAHGWRNKLKYNVSQRILGHNIVPNTDAFNKLSNIHNKIQGFDTEAKTFWNQFLRNTKTLNNLDDLIGGPGGKAARTNILNLSKASGDHAKFARNLAKNFHKFSSVDDFNKYLDFLNRQKLSITNFDNFLSNTIKSGPKIINMTHLEQNKFAQSPKLNQTFLDKRVNWMKNNFKKSAETLRKLAPKSPYQRNIIKTAEKLTEISKVDNETYKVLQSSDKMGNAKWVGTMSKHKGFLAETSQLLKLDSNFSKALSKTKNTKEVREVFAKFGKQVPGDVPEEFLQQISKTKNTKKILDTVKYAERYDDLNKLMKTLRHPTMKYAARVVGRALVVGTIAVGGFTAYNTYQEGTRLRETNQSRGKLKQREAFYDIGLALAGACAFVPGVGWIAGGAILAGTLVAGYVKESVFGTLDKYNKNYKDFLSDSPLLIKQHIITTILGDEGKERSFKENVARLFHSKKLGHLVGKTGSEATKALLYIDEWKDNPLAMINIQDTALMNQLSQENPPITRAMVAEAVENVENNVAKRYEFLKSHLGTVNYKQEDGKITKHLNINKVINSSVISNYKGINKIDQMLLASKYNLNNPDDFEKYKDVEKMGLSLSKELKKDKNSFNKLESLFNKDIRSLAYMYRYSFDFEPHMRDYSIDDEGNSSESNYDSILKNTQYLQDYVMYKSITDGVDFGSLVLQKEELPNLISIRDFLVDFNINKPLSSVELYGSGFKFQNVLYRIAVEVFGVTNISNKQKDLLRVFDEAYEHSYGIYFKKGDINRLCVNGSGAFGRDKEYVLNDSNLREFKNDIESRASSGRLVGKGTTGKSILNKELVRRYKKIIDEELNR